VFVCVRFMFVLFFCVLRAKLPEIKLMMMTMMMNIRPVSMCLPVVVECCRKDSKVSCLLQQRSPAAERQQDELRRRAM